MILTGNFRHTVDSKNRIFLPAKLRKDGKTFIITNGLDNCLYVYPEKSWVGIVEKFDALPLKDKTEERAFKRAFFSGAQEVQVDNMGRIVLPSKMLKDIGASKTVIIVGVWKRLEIWSEKNWTSYSKKAKSALNRVSQKLEI